MRRTPNYTQNDQNFLTPHEMSISLTEMEKIMSTRESEMYQKIYNQFSSWLTKLRNDNNKKDLMRSNRHVWGYITALVDYKIITNEEYQTLTIDLRLAEGA